MNVHYLELRTFLEEVVAYPDRLLDHSTSVFTTEIRLHTDKKLNHRIKTKFIYDSLFDTNNIDLETTFPRIRAASASMLNKLNDYKKDQLPGGRYWHPTNEDKALLNSLLPNNDICESILGLNDWLSTQKANLKQITKSTLVEVQKNKTMAWLKTLPETEKEKAINVSQMKRRIVESTIKEDEQCLKEKRIKKLVNDKKRAEEKQERRQSEIEKLRNIPIINSISSLDEELDKINEDTSITIPGKERKKLEILKNQIKIRNKIYGKAYKITFSEHGIAKTSDELREEVINMLKSEDSRKRGSTNNISNAPKRKKLNAAEHTSEQLVGKDVIHKFMNENTSKDELWSGKIISYNPSTKEHTLQYTGDSEQYIYNLSSDINNGDLWLIE